jgi:hypothetical protein
MHFSSIVASLALAGSVIAAPSYVELSPCDQRRVSDSAIEARRQVCSSLSVLEEGTSLVLL